MHYWLLKESFVFTRSAADQHSLQLMKIYVCGVTVLGASRCQSPLIWNKKSPVNARQRTEYRGFTVEVNSVYHLFHYLDVSVTHGGFSQVLLMLSCFQIPTPPGFVCSKLFLIISFNSQTVQKC